MTVIKAKSVDPTCLAAGRLQLASTTWAQLLRVDTTRWPNLLGGHNTSATCRQERAGCPHGSQAATAADLFCFRPLPGHRHHRLKQASSVLGKVQPACCGFCWKRFPTSMPSLRFIGEIASEGGGTPAETLIETRSQPLLTSTRKPLLNLSTAA